MQDFRELREQDATQEILILRQKLEESDRRLTLVGGAVLESVYRMHATMKRLLAANDVNEGRPGHEQMRVNILGEMNDMARNLVGFFSNKELIVFDAKDVWPPTGRRDANHD